MEKTEVIRALGALSHPLRLDVFRALIVAGSGGRTPGDLMAEFEVPSATLSFNLKELAAAGLVTQERASRNIVYRASYAQMNGLLAYLTQNCCAGVPCSADDASAAACGR